MKTLGVILAALLCVGFSCCRKRVATTSPDVIVLHTGRMRGNAYPEGVGGAIPLQYYPYLAGYVNLVRQEARGSGATVILGDLGDSLSGSFASHVTGGQNMVTLFNALNYDFVALGNLDSDVPPEAIGQLKPVALCPFVTGAGEPAMPGARVSGRIQSGALTVDLLSNFSGNLDPASDPLRFPAAYGPTGAEPRPVREYVLPEGKPGDLTLLSWMKFEVADTPPRTFLGALTHLGVDLILAQRITGGSKGETWKTSTAASWDPPVSENILRNNLGFTVARANLKREGSRWKLLSSEVVPLTSNTAPPDPRIAEAMAPFKQRIDAANETVGVLAKGCSNADIYETYLSALGGISGVNAIVYSTESIRGEWPAGELRASKVFETLPWTSKLLIVELTSEQLRQVREIPRLEVLDRKDRGDATVHAVTSEYFAHLIRHRIGEVPTRPASGTGEFDFFIDALKRAALGEPARSLGPSQLDPEVWGRD